jgi:hypothetical protein
MEFTMNGTDGPTVNVAAVTKKTMGMLYKADPTMKIKAKVDYEGTIDKLSEFPTTNKNFSKFFEVEEDKWNNRTKVFVGMTVELSTDINNLKHQNRGELMNALQANNIWLKKNTFKTMKATTIGFQYLLHVGYVWRPDLQGNMRLKLEQQHPGVEIPPFVIQNGRPRVPDFNGKKYSMNALLVICSVDDAEELSKLMMTTKFPQGQCGRFSPIRIKDKSILPRIAMAQNTFEQTARTVTVLGVHEDRLYGHIKAGNINIMSEDNVPNKETLEEALMREAVDANGKPMILSIERTIKSDSRGKWNVICSNSDHQERVENYLENNLERLYVTSEITPEQENFNFGKPRISGGDLRSVAASYVSALTVLPELNSEDEQSTAGMHRAPKRIKGRSIMVEASSEKIYAGKPRGDWASKVKAAGGTTATTTTIGTMGTQSHDTTNKVLGTASISSAGQSTLTAQTTQTKQEIALANRMESYKRETEKQIKELKESVAMLQQKLVDTEERMDQQADILGNIMEQNTLTKDKLDMVEKNNDIRHSKLDNNMELMLAHWGITARSDSSNRTPESSPARKRKTKRKTPVRRPPVNEEKQMDISMENNRFGALTEDEEGSSSDDDMMASDDDEEDEVATFIGGDDSDASHADE